MYARKGGKLEKLLSVENLTVKFGKFQAVQEVNFELHSGEIVGLVGESGSGKSTLGRAVLGLTPFQSGSVKFLGQSLGKLSRKVFLKLRPAMQMVFQNPMGSLDPHQSVGSAIMEVLRVVKHATDEEAFSRMKCGLEEVGLDSGLAHRYPHELSGGQRQRVAIARALAVEPRLLIADEPTSALDGSAQAHILDLLRGLVRNRRIGLLLITHDLSVVKLVADRAGVMHRGRIIETGSVEKIWSAPSHAYTQRLLAAVPQWRR